MKRKKLTLIELIIVILVLGLLVGLAIPQFTGVKSNAEVSSLKNDLDVLSTAIAEQYIKEDTLPLGGAVILPDGDLKDYILARGDDTTKLFKVDLLKTETYHNKLKSKVDADNYFIYSTKTGNVYHSTGRVNGDGKFVFGIKEFPFITLMGGKPLSSESINISEVTSITLSGEMNPGDAVSVILNDIAQTITTGDLPFIKNLQAASNTYSVNLTLLDDAINKVVVKVGKTEETYKILVGEVTDEEVIVNTDGVIKIATGYAHTILLMEDGTVKSFGLNHRGQLGTIDNISTLNSNPIPTTILGITNVKDVYASLDFSMLLMEDGTVKSFGNNWYGQLGNNTNTSTNNPNYVPTVIQGVTDIKNISLGYAHTLLLKNDGTVLTFGRNSYGELGRTANSIPNPNPTLLSVSDVKDLSAGYNHSLLLMQDGTVKGFGFNAQGQLGSYVNVRTVRPNPTPTTIDNLSGVKKLVSGENHSLALMEDGTVKGFGVNDYGQLGLLTNLGNTNANPTPTTIPNILGVKDISTNQKHTLLQFEDGTVKSFGLNDYGQLGRASSSIPNATPIIISEITNVKNVFAGMECSFLLMNDGSVKSFGTNLYGQLGTLLNIGTLNTNPTPTEVVLN